MSQLQTLDGEPLCWSDLKALNEAWWADERKREAERQHWLKLRGARMARVELVNRD